MNKKIFTYLKSKRKKKLGLFGIPCLFYRNHSCICQNETAYKNCESCYIYKKSIQPSIRF